MGKIAGYPMQRIKRRTLVFEGRSSAPKSGAVLACGYVAIRAPSEIARSEYMQCYACPRAITEPKVAEERIQTPVLAPAVDLSPVLSALTDLRKTLSGMEDRITQLEDLKTQPETIVPEDPV